jgi:hypothetical protein
MKRLPRLSVQPPEKRPIFIVATIASSSLFKIGSLV